MDRLRLRPARSRAYLVALGVCVGLCAVETAMTQAPRTAPVEVDDRARLLTLQREAANLLKRAAQSDAPIDDKRRALLDAARRLEALGAEPSPRGSSGATQAPPLTPALRA